MKIDVSAADLHIIRGSLRSRADQLLNLSNRCTTAEQLRGLMDTHRQVEEVLHRLLEIHFESEPTDAQWAALRAYKEWAGRNWKAKLNQDWQRAGSDFPGDYAPLQQLRNNFGPSWLMEVKLL